LVAWFRFSPRRAVDAGIMLAMNRPNLPKKMAHQEIEWMNLMGNVA
jgi:hypothetical protein